MSRKLSRLWSCCWVHSSVRQVIKASGDLVLVDVSIPAISRRVQYSWIVANRMKLCRSAPYLSTSIRMQFSGLFNLTALYGLQFWGSSQSLAFHQRWALGDHSSFSTTSASCHCFGYPTLLMTALALLIATNMCMCGFPCLQLFCFAIW